MKKDGGKYSLPLAVYCSTDRLVLTDGYAVAASSHWNNFSSLSGDDLRIYITGSFSVSGGTGNTFGSATSLTIQGNYHELSLGSTNGSLLVVGSGQTVTINNLTFEGKQGNSAPLVSITGGNQPLISTDDDIEVVGGVLQP